VQDQKKQLPSVTVSAFLMSLGTLVSRLLGLLRESLFAALFPRWVTDAWYVAFRLPNIFRRLFGEGSLSVSFIPIFIQAQKEGRGVQLVSGFFMIFSSFLLTITIFGTLYMEFWLSFFLDSSYVEQAEKYAMTVRMARIMFAYIYLVCLYAFVMAILNALGQFGKAALAPAFFNVIIVLSTLIPPSVLAWDGQALAWGVLVGGVCQLAFLIPALIRSGYWPQIQLQNIWIPPVQKVFLQMLPGLVGMGLLQIMTLVNLKFASQLESGSISYITLADRLLELPLSLISVSLGVALLPTLSRIWLSSDRAHFTQVSSHHFKLNLFLSLPCAVGIYVLSQPIIELLFQRGQFTITETLITARILQVYALLILFSSSVRVFVPAFYAIKNTWYPALVSALCLVFHVLLVPQLISRYQVLGLVGSTVVSSGLNLIFLILGYRIFIGSYPWPSVLWSFFRFLIPATSMIFVLHGYSFLRESLGNSFLSRFVSLFLIIGLAGITYFLVSSLVKIPEIKGVLFRLEKKIKRNIKT
jgi:putative peptidoglycan lipid II flippase